jgi:DNA repair exonuclease SbcCD ATPase subunit
MNPRHKPIAVAAGVLLAVWALAMGGYVIAKNAKVTGEKVRAYLAKTDLSKLKDKDRAQALKQLADYMNQLSPDERRNTRMDREWGNWFKAMNDQEKGELIEATMPSGITQMLTAFEQLPPEKRKKAIEDSLKRLREARSEPRNAGQWQGKDAPPPLSEDLQKRAAAAGLGAFYSQSSAQTKAELAPLLEEIQRSMESGRMMRPGR